MSSIFNLPANTNPPAIPRGVADFFGGPAVSRRQAEAMLRERARRWAYVEVIPPTFEYAETLAAEAGAQLAEELYRFLDRDGRALALRPDLTIPTARLAGSKLYDQPLPQRFFYAGPAFRYEDPRAGRQREFWQAGIELMGVSSAEADAEVLAFAAHSLQAMQLQDFRFTLGHLGYFHGLVEDLRLQVEQVEALQAALDRKSSDTLEDLVVRLQLAPDEQAATRGLLELSGADVDAVLARAAGLARNDKMAAAVARLRDVLARLSYDGFGDAFILDLSDVRGMNYYTGVTFKAYTAEMGFSIVNGGRYDNLVGHFGPARPAVGCAFYLDRILLARQRQSGPAPEPGVDVLVYPCQCGAYLQIVAHARDRDQIAALALGPEDEAAYPRVLRCTCDGWVVERQGDQKRRRPLAEWLSDPDTTASP